jgi:Ca2+-binding RTX toxin-like protein
MGSLFQSSEATKPASEAEKEQYRIAVDFFETLQLPDVITGSTSQKVFVVNFDGTGNNQYTNPGEASNVALLDSALEAVEDAKSDSSFVNTYQIGVGTEGSAQALQQALALGAKARVQDAIDVLRMQYAQWLADSAGQPFEPYILVTGFSRGSAEARLFMNVIDQYGIPALNDPGVDLVYNAATSLKPPGSVHMSALLYDTVGTGMTGNFNIPDTVDSVVHFTSQDERRVFFPLMSIESGPGEATNRLIEVQLPGVHSDIGGGYSVNGVSFLNLYFAKQVLEEWGVPVTSFRPDISDASAVWALHDSVTVATKIWTFFAGMCDSRVVKSYANNEILDSADQAYLTDLYTGIPGGWAGDANVPASIQSPPFSQAPAGQTFSSVVRSIDLYQGDITALIEAAAAAQGTTTDAWALSDADQVAVGDAVVASHTVFSTVWGADAFFMDDYGNLQLKADATDFAAASQQISDLFATNAGLAFNTAALLARCVYAFDLTADVGYLQLQNNLALLDTNFAEVLKYYDGRGSYFAVQLGIADSATSLVDLLTGKPILALGFDGDDYLEVSTVGSQMFGGKGADILVARADAYLEGGRGEDWLIGSAGNDTYVLYAGDGADTVQVGGGYDRLTSNASAVSFIRQDLDLLVSLDAGATSVRVMDWYTPGSVDHMLGEVVVGGVTYSREAISAAGLTVDGSDNPGIADFIMGIPGYSDIIYAHAGDDYIDVSWSDESHVADTVWAGAGNDVVYAGNGADALWGEAGDDELRGYEGNDWLAGGTGNDELFGGEGANVYSWGAGEGVDTVTSHSGMDILNVSSVAGLTSLTASFSGDDLVLSAQGTSGNAGGVVLKNWGQGIGQMDITLPGGAIISPEQLNALFKPATYGLFFPGGVASASNFESIIRAQGYEFAIGADYASAAWGLNWLEYVWDSGLNGAAPTGETVNGYAVRQWGSSYGYNNSAFAPSEPDFNVWADFQYQFWETPSGAFNFSLISEFAGTGGQRINFRDMDGDGWDESWDYVPQVVRINAEWLPVSYRESPEVTSVDLLTMSGVPLTDSSAEPVSLVGWSSLAPEPVY